MAFTLPANVAPTSPVTYEWLQALMESQAQENPANGLVAAGTSISNATTNSPLVVTPGVIAAPAPGSVYLLKAWGIVSAPASSMATLSFICYSGGSGGTALATVVAFQPTASLASGLFEVEAYVGVISSTKYSCNMRGSIASSTSTSTCTEFAAGPTATAGTTVVDSNTLGINAVMGTAVSGSSFQVLGGFTRQMS